MGVALLLSINDGFEFSDAHLHLLDGPLADDRANKAGHDAQHFEGLLREESAKLVKLNTAKQSLESEVKSLSVRIEEIESTAMVSSKRTIQKMEMRITELETIIDTEKKSHAATMMELHKKERSIKELILQSEEDRKNIIILQESLDKLNEKIKMYKRQLEEQESISNQYHACQEIPARA